MQLPQVPRFTNALLLALAATTLASCGSSSASDKRAVLAAKMIYWTIESDDSAYTREGDGWFHLSSTSSTSSFIMVDVAPGKGDVPKIDFNDAMTMTDTELPNRAAGDEQKVRLTREGDTVYLEHRVRTSGETPAEAYSMELKDEVEFTYGDWFDFEAGDPVSFRLSEAGLETSQASVKKQFADLFTPMIRGQLLDDLKELKQQQGWSISDSDLGRLAYVETEVDFQSFPNTEYRFTGDKISYSEIRPIKSTVWIGMGLTSENFK